MLPKYSKCTPDCQILVLSAAASFLLSAWSAYAQYIPNPDAMYYLRAAELFRTGKWEEAIAVYRWPFYSMTIAAAMKTVGVSAFVGAQLINAIFDCFIVIVFIELSKALADKQTARRISLWAAIIILLHPRLTNLRSVVIRDHGFHAFSLAALYFTVKDHKRPHFLYKGSCCASIFLAALFRLEALYLSIVIPTFYLFIRASTIRSALIAVGVILLACMALVPAATIWTSGTVIPSALNLTLTLSELLSPLKQLASTIAGTASKFQSILPPGRNAGGLSYGSTVAILTIDSCLRATTIPLAILALICFVPRRLTSPFATNFIAWFSAWQIPVLLAFTTSNLFLDWRYAMLLAFLFAIPASFTVCELSKDAKHGTANRRGVFLAAILAILIPWLIALPRYTRLDHLKQAGIWIAGNLPKDAIVLVNDGRIAYYSGRAYETTITVSKLADLDWPSSSYAVLDLKSAPPDKLQANEKQGKLMNIIPGLDGHNVYIYRSSSP